MRILQVNFCRSVGGSAFHHADLALGVAARGHDVLVVDRLGDFTTRQTDGLVRHAAARRGLLHLSLASAVRAFRPDLIHAHQSLAARIANRIKGDVPVAATIHGEYKARSYGRSQGIIRVADHQKAGMTGFGGASVTIWNWLRRTSPPARSGVDIRAELGIAPDAVVYGNVGRVLADKGIFDLVHAFQQMRDAGARLLIVGEGKDLPSARQQAGNDARIIFTGHREDVPSLLAAIDVFVMPSHAEAFPLVLIEAAAAGCAIIATETKGAKELLSGQPATLVPMSDRVTLIQAMGNLLAKGRAGNARPIYDLSGFERDGQIEKTVAFYRSLLLLRGDR